MEWKDLHFKDFTMCSPVYLPVKGDIKDKYYYPPYRIDILKREKCAPFKAYDMKSRKEKIYTSTNFVIGCLRWNEHEDTWNFESCLTRWLEYSDTLLNRWVYDWCENHYIDEDGELQEMVLEED